MQRNFSPQLSCTLTSSALYSSPTATNSQHWCPSVIQAFVTCLGFKKIVMYGFYPCQGPAIFAQTENHAYSSARSEARLSPSINICLLDVPKNSAIWSKSERSGSYNLMLEINSYLPQNFCLESK